MSHSNKVPIKVINHMVNNEQTYSFLQATISRSSLSSSVFSLCLCPPDTKLSSMPALFNLTSTSLHRETRQRSENGSVSQYYLWFSFISSVVFLFSWSGCGSHCGSLSCRIICHLYCAARTWCLCVREARLTLFRQSTVMLDFFMHQ